MSFADEDAALEYAIKSQTDRRELTQAEKAKCIRTLDERKAAGRPQKELASIDANLKTDGASPSTEKGKSAEKTAAVVGVNTATVERARLIQKESPDLYQAVEEGKIPSINAAYEENQRRKGKGRLALSQSCLFCG